jgi:uncharacterized protein (TIGR02466 family)
MIHSANSNSLFSTPVVYTSQNQINDQNFQDTCRRIVKEKGRYDFYCPCLTTVQTETQVLNLPGFEAAKTAAIVAVTALAQTWQVSTDKLEIVDSWINLYDIHGYQDLHQHPDSLISGCMYVKSQGSNDLVFNAPWLFYQAIPPKFLHRNLSNCQAMYYASLEGRCYAWPSHLLHRTLPAHSERISISFNAKYV